MQQGLVSRSGLTERAARSRSHERPEPDAAPLDDTFSGVIATGAEFHAEVEAWLGELQAGDRRHTVAGLAAAFVLSIALWALLALGGVLVASAWL